MLPIFNQQATISSITTLTILQVAASVFGSSQFISISALWLPLAYLEAREVTMLARSITKSSRSAGVGRNVTVKTTTVSLRLTPTQYLDSKFSTSISYWLMLTESIDVAIGFFINHHS
jgi:hypothetical protein